MSKVTQKVLDYNRERLERLFEFGVLLDPDDDTRLANEGKSNYSEHIQTPWSIWQEYGLNAWDSDIVKRVLRKKEGDSREMDYRKIIHICRERLRQLKNI